MDLFFHPAALLGFKAQINTEISDIKKKTKTKKQPCKWS